MDRRDVRKTITEFKNALERKGIKVKQVILYGSWAQGTQNENSDIDLIVVSEDFEGRGYWERIDVICEVLYELFVPIEAVALTPTEWERGEASVCDFAKTGKTVFV